MQELYSSTVSGPVTRILFSPIEDAIVCCCDSDIQLYDYRSGISLKKTLSTAFRRVVDVSYHPQDASLAAVGWGYDYLGDAAIEIWNKDLVKRVSADLGRNGHRVRFSPDGKWLIAVGSEGTFQVLALPGYEITYQFRGAEQHSALDYHPDGETILSSRWAQGDTSIHFCKVGPDLPHRLPSESKSFLPEWEEWSDKWEENEIPVSEDICDAKFSPNGSYIACSHKYVQIFEFPSRKLVRTITEKVGVSDVVDPRAGITELYWSNPVFSPDSRYVYAGSATGNIFCWDIQTGEVVERFTSHSSGVRHLAFSLDGSFLASCSNDNILKLWQVSKQKQ